MSFEDFSGHVSQVAVFQVDRVVRTSAGLAMRWTALPSRPPPTERMRSSERGKGRPVKKMQAQDASSDESDRR